MYLKKLYMCRNYVLFVFHNLFVSFRATSVDIEEANRTVYLNMTRTNGIDLAVSVEWETISETAFGISTFYFLWEQNSITKKGRMYKIYIFPHELYLMDLLKMQNRYSSIAAKNSYWVSIMCQAWYWTHRAQSLGKERNQITKKKISVKGKFLVLWELERMLSSEFELRPNAK